MNIVLVEANDDDVTAPVHEARKKELASLDSGAHRVDKLFGVNANRASLTAAWVAIRGSFDLVSGLGHGDESTFTGHQQRDILTLSQTLGTSSAIVHLFSCNCGLRLGEKLVQSGAKAFIGYRDYVSIPEERSLVQLFVREDTALDKAIAAGKDSTSAKREADAAYQAARAELTASEYSTAADIAALESNHQALVGPWVDTSKWGRF